jgi:DNA-binding transcriptional regulator YdaS (Cro superfamily)
MPPKLGRPEEPLDGPIGELALAVGGTSALAALVGVDRRTIRRWADGTRDPYGPAKVLLANLAIEHGTPIPFK